MQMFDPRVTTHGDSDRCQHLPPCARKELGRIQKLGVNGNIGKGRNGRPIPSGDPLTPLAPRVCGCFG